MGSYGSYGNGADYDDYDNSFYNGYNVSYDDNLQNETDNNTIVVHADRYSTIHIIIYSILLTFVMIVVVIGNMLVIIAIATEKTLKNIQNWFIASLAVADFFVGLVIMPFSLANELMDYWIFGAVWCSIHGAMDVLLCTSSIMNICLISLDRYWSITQAVDYLKKRTPARAAVMITMVWALSALISIPPLLGWKAPDDITNKPLPKCELSKEIGYVLYSAFGSFYIPSCIMVFVYIRIYFAARDRARRQIRKSPRPRPQQSSTTIEETTSARNTGNSTPKIPPPSSSLKMVTSPVELNVSPRPATPVATTTTGENVTAKTVKQVGFQEPLVSSTEPPEVVVKPEITVESCSPEDSTDIDSAAAGEGGQKESNSCGKSGGDNVTIVSAACVIKQVQVEDETRTKNNNNSCDDNENTRDQESDEAISHETEQKNTIATVQVEAVAVEVAEGEVKVEVEMTDSDKKKEISTSSAVAVAISDDGKQEPKQPRIPTIQLREAIEDKVECAPPPLPPPSSQSKENEENKITDLQSNGARRQQQQHQHHQHSHNKKDDIATRRGKRPKLHFLRVEPPPIWRTSSSLSLNGDVHILGTLSRSCSRLQLDTDPVSDVEPSSSDSGAVSRCAVVKPLKLRLCQPFFGKKSHSKDLHSGKVRRDVMDTGRLPSPKQEVVVRDPEREKRRIARKKEKRATLILGLIMGSFILCWLPFFCLYVLEAFCLACVPAGGFSVAFWLGYMNSALNPVIYTIFNKDFRRAFRRILFK